jgi:hypothetical protein
MTQTNEVPAVIELINQQERHPKLVNRKIVANRTKLYGGIKSGLPHWRKGGGMCASV